MRGVVPDQVVERLAVGVNLTGLNCLTELRLIASDRLELFLECVADVDYERGLLIVLTERERMNDFARAVHWNFGLDLLEAGDEARIARQLRHDWMIGMPT